MIAITDTSAFSGLEFVETPSPFLIPSESEIENLVPANAFINATVTTAFKTLLKRMSTESLDPTFGTLIQPNSLLTKISGFFNAIGFYFDSGVVSYLQNAFDLDFHTSEIINNINNYTSFQEKAYKAFHDNTWSKEANDIRALENTGLQKLHYVSVHYLSANTSTILNNLENEFERITKIRLNSSSPDSNNDYKDPMMPGLEVTNNSDEEIRIRLKISFENQTSRMDSMYGPTESFDVDANNTLDQIGLNRSDTQLFPEQGEFFNPPNLDDHTIKLEVGQTREIVFGTTMRGGKATFQFVPNADSALPIDENQIHSLSFFIIGVNPSYDNVLWYLNRQRTENGQQITYLDRFWFLMRKIRLESGSGNSAKGNDEMLNFQKSETRMNTNYGLKWKGKDGKTELRATGFPTWGYPRGFGLGQIDNLGSIDGLANLQAIVPNFTSMPLGSTIIDNQGRTLLKTGNTTAYIVAASQEIWNWKENIDTAYRFFKDEKIPQVIEKISSIRSAVINWNVSNPNNLVSIPAPVDYNSVRYAWVDSSITEFNTYNNLFQQGIPPVIPNPNNLVVKSFFDAMLIKSYNGNSGGYFMDISNPGGNVKPTITINPSNVKNYFYVRELSNRYD